MSKGIEILLDSARGQYLPRDAAEILRPEWFARNDVRMILAAGPDHERYWEAWGDTLDHARFKDADGNVWRLWQDGDLFAYCDALMTDAEYLDFFGEERE